MRKIIGLLLAALAGGIIGSLMQPERERVPKVYRRAEEPKPEPAPRAPGNLHFDKHWKAPVARLSALAGIGLMAGAFAFGIVGPPSADAHNGVRHGGEEAVAAVMEWHACAVATGTTQAAPNLIPAGAAGVNGVPVFVVDPTPGINQALARSGCSLGGYNDLNAICASGLDLEDCSADHWNDRSAGVETEQNRLAGVISKIIAARTYRIMFAGTFATIDAGSAQERALVQDGWLDLSAVALIGSVG